MPRSIKMIAMTAALLLVVGVAPAYADEDDTTDTTEAPETEAVEDDEEPDGSHLNGKLLVLFSRGFDFSKGSALGELIYAFLEEVSGEVFNWGDFDQWLAAGEIASEVPFELSDEQRILIETFVDSPPKNFGALVSALRKHHGRNENSPVYAAAADGESKKGKKPDHPNKGGKKNNG